MHESTAPITSPTDRTSSRDRVIRVITAGSLLNSFGFGIWRSLFTNFAEMAFAATAIQIGLAQSIREIPGLLGAGVGLLALAFSEIRIAIVSVVAMGAGIVMTGASGDFPNLLLSTFVMSAGFHVFVSASWSAILHVTGKSEAPRALGRLNSLNSAAAVAAAVAVYLMLDTTGFRSLFVIAGSILVVGGLVLFPFSRQHSRSATRAGRTTIRKEYWVYYALEFLMGSRRHIFSTFAIYLLVREHGVPAETIAILFALNNLIGSFLFRYFGGIIARFGERRVLKSTLLLLSGVFLGYAVIDELAILYIFFLLDQVLFGFSIATQSFFHKIAINPEEITQNISLGQTINHIAAVIIPVTGGWVWDNFGGQYTFLAGVLIVLISLVVVGMMRTEDNP